jgi:release factor glutamine methyltransferase
LAYVIGWTPFLDCRIYLDSHPLIPRPETEYWVEQSLPLIRSIANPRVLDLFSGSGAIGVAVLSHLADARVDFGELNLFHLQVITKNIRENNIAYGRAKVIQTDVWSAITEKYDIVLANPPYISRERTGRVQDSVLDHEPHDALFAEDGGFALIERTVREARAHLSATGHLFIEHEPEQAERLLATAKLAGFMAENRKDQYGTIRFSVLSPVA